MRAQSKPFTVEVKSSRRIDRSKEKSIWGNIDLSAIAGEVAEATHVPNEDVKQAETIAAAR